MKKLVFGMGIFFITDRLYFDKLKSYYEIWKFNIKRLNLKSENAKIENLFKFIENCLNLVFFLAYNLCY